MVAGEATKPSWSVMDSGSGEDNTAVQASVCALETPMLVNSVPVMLTLDSMAVSSTDKLLLLFIDVIALCSAPEFLHRMFYFIFPNHVTWVWILGGLLSGLVSRQ